MYVNHSADGQESCSTEAYTHRGEDCTLLGLESPAKIKELTLLRPIHGNL